MRKLSFAVYLCLFWLLVMSAPAASLFNFGTNWSYFIGTQEASTPSSAWRSNNFNDSSWLTGPAPIGYAAPANDPAGYEATIRTTLPTSTVGNYTTVYMRKTFVVADPNSFTQLKFDVVVDDGYVVWVNGVNVGSNNAPGIELAYNAVASSSPEPNLSSFTVNYPSNILVAGTNVVAIHLLNGALSSSDLFLDASLAGIPGETVPPTITSKSPVPGTVTNLNQISVTFSEPVTGVNAADLLINGQPASSVSSNNNTYAFSFGQPAYGNVQISWAAAHGITDLAFPPNPFDANAVGATWQYSLNDNVPPTVVSRVPAAGFTIRSLKEIQVQFSEPVTGVNASDLIISGNAATNVIFTAPSTFAFQFPQPPTGNVVVVWAGGHGIRDLATPANNFAGAGWLYTLNPNAPEPDVIITEFMAANAHTLADEDNQYSDWIEIYNSGEVAVNLDGWHLTDNRTDLTKWTFPPTNIAGHAFIIVFASGKDRRIPGRTLHTSFQLAQEGEYLGLVKPDGVTIASAFSPTFPTQVGDVSYGLPTLSSPTVVLALGAPANVFVPINNNLGLDWTAPAFNDSAWLHGTNGVGFETTPVAPSLTGSFSTDIDALMRTISSSAFIRIPFVVSNASTFDVMKLRMKYDDGFVAYINGSEVARRNVDPALSPEWNSVALSSRADTQASIFEDIDISGAKGGIQTGTNWLAIQGLNFSAADGDFLIAASIETYTRALQLDQVRYFTVPTPGSDNGVGVENLGPIISEAAHTPNTPNTNQDIVVTARVTPTFSPVSSVSLSYQIMFMGINTLPMLDDGLHGDGAAGDGVYGAFIPSALSTNGQMRRWFISATDTAARPTRYPPFVNATNSPEFLGTIVQLAQTNSLPILHLFIPAATLALAEGNSITRYPCSIFYLGKFYDNCGINRHGQSSAGFPKKSYDIDFTAGTDFIWKEGEAPVDDINLLTTYPDKAHLRNFLGYYGTYQAADSPHHFVEHVRVQHNGAFFGDWHMMENGDSQYLKRLGYDPNGALYKMYQDFTLLSHTTISVNANAEKKSRKQEGNADIVALFNGVSPTVNTVAAGRNTYMWDNIDVPEVVNTMAARIVTGDVDCCHKNYYFYRDSDGTGEWRALPWDIDLSFGRNWNATTTYWDDPMYPNNGLFVGNNNPFFGVVFNSGAGATGFPQSQQMYLRRLRTLLDEILQPTNTPPSELKFEKQIDELVAKMMPDATLDLQKWGTWGHGTTGIANNDPSYLTVTQAIQQLKDYLPQRRNALIHARTAGSSTLLPASQPTNVLIQIGAIEFNPSSANQTQEYIQLINTNSISVDITGWKLDGAVKFTFRGGTVLVSNSVTYVSPNVKSFRARTTGPRGGQNLLVVGPYEGQLSARGESLTLTDRGGRLVNSNAYIGAPSLPQQYLRVTEIMYHPPAPAAGSLYSLEEFEYIELKNTGPVPMDLTGVHFTNGVEFTFGSINLAAGARIVVAKNLAAFASRYPGVANVTGPYIGYLENKGETIRLDDAVGEKILDFTYNNAWYPMTDGPGLSLVIVDENALWNTWDLKISWRAGSEYSGTPGGASAAPLPPFSTILVNELLTHTDLPQLDAIELYNPTANAVNIGNWLISDDFVTPKKFRIPAATIIPAGGYLTFSELDFNTGPTAFSFSSQGDEAYLFSGDASGNPNGYYHGFNFDGAQNGVTFGRYINSSGDEHFVAQSSNTLNAANSLPKVGPVIITEIMYHPLDIVIGTNILDDADNEFVELQNITTTNVPLYDVAFPTNKWKLTDAIEYTFSTNDVIPPNGLLVVVSFNPATNVTALAAFRAKYGISPSVPIVGPYSGKLDNSEDKVEIYRPDVPDALGVPYILVERVHYRDLPTWDIIADGLGASLQRRVLGAYGNDPTNWVAASPSPGAPRAGGTPLTITQQPSHATVFAAGTIGTSTVYLFGTTNFTALVSGTGVSYQWRFNGVIIPGATGATLTLTNIQPAQAGQYSFLAFNGAGSVVSSNATLTVINPVTFTVQPASQNVLVATNVTLTATAVGTGPVTYQWRFEGTNIPNATNASYSFVNANLFAHHGLFSVVASDSVSTAVSSNARIYVLVRPFVTQHITGQTVPLGGTAIFSLVVTGAQPMVFRWIRNNGNLDPIFTSEPILVLTNVQVGYPLRVVVTNLATGQAQSPQSGNVTLAVSAAEPDADGDGIPDAWEIAYFGSVNTTNNAANALLDFDSDGMSNLDEYRAGTDPTNPLSLLKVVLTTTNANVIQFVAQTNVTYTVQAATNLTGAVWNRVTNIGPATTVRTIQVDTAPVPGVSQRYIRVVTPLVP